MGSAGQAVSTRVKTMGFACCQLGRKRRRGLALVAEALTMSSCLKQRSQGHVLTHVEETSADLLASFPHSSAESSLRQTRSPLR